MMDITVAGERLTRQPPEDLGRSGKCLEQILEILPMLTPVEDDI